MTNVDVQGPIDFVLMEFPGDKFTGEMAEEIANLLEAGIIRLYDVLVVRKEADGTFSGLELDALADDEVGGLRAFSGARSGLLGDEDLQLAADAMAPGTTAVLLVYENSWAAGFVAAARRAGGEMIASARIPAQDVMDAIEALEA